MYERLRGKNTNWELHKEEIVEMLERKVQQKDIAAHFNVDPSNLNKALARMGIRKEEPGKRSEAKREDWTEWVKENRHLTQMQMAHHIGICWKTISKWAAKWKEEGILEKKRYYPTGRPKKEDWIEYVKQNKDILSLKEMGAHIGINKNKISRWVMEITGSKKVRITGIPKKEKKPKVIRVKKAKEKKPKKDEPTVWSYTPSQLKKEPPMKTIVRDESQYVSVKVNSKTWIKIHKDKDPIATIEDWKQRHNKY